MFPIFDPAYYYIEFGLQAICVIHCLWKRNDLKWILLLVFLPLIGCIAYIFMEIFSRRHLDKVQSGVGKIVKSTGSIKKLENRLKFSDTFSNRVMLADAYYAAGKTERAIELYESSLTGTFTENEMVLTQLVYAYNDKQQYDDIVKVVKKIYKLPQFTRSTAHTIYAIALWKTGQPLLAEQEFKTMLGRFSNFENRYQYGLFLIAQSRGAEAATLYAAMIDEGAHLTGHEKSSNRQWINKAKGALRRNG